MYKPRLAEHGQISNISPYPSSQRMPAQQFFLLSGDHCNVISFDNLDQANLLECFWENKEDLMVLHSYHFLKDLLCWKTRG